MALPPVAQTFLSAVGQTFLSGVGQTFLSASGPRVRGCTHSRRAGPKEEENGLLAPTPG
jgi:hypothetical protein